MRGAGPDDVGLVVGIFFEGFGGGFGGFDGEDAGEFVVGNGDGGLGGDEGGLVGVGEEEDGFGYVVNFVGGEAGVVLGEVDDGVFAGDVQGADDGEVSPVDVVREGDGFDTATGDGGADGAAVPHVGECLVVDVLGGAEDFGAALLAEGRGADDGGAVGHRPRARGVWGIR